jgi:hypothetical protein
MPHECRARCADRPVKTPTEFNMRMMRFRARFYRLAIILAGGAFLLNGCDPTIQSTVENGIINVANTFYGSVLQSVLSILIDNAASGTA